MPPGGDVIQLHGTNVTCYTRFAKAFKKKCNQLHFLTKIIWWRMCNQLHLCINLKE